MRVVWLVALLVLGACGETEETRVYIGALGESLVAAVVGETEFVAYRCGSAATLAEDTTWFAGSVHGDRAMGDGFVGTADGAALDSELTVGGDTEALRLQSAAPDAAGLFSLLEADGCRTALVIREGGAGFDSRGAHFCPGGVFSQVTPVSVGVGALGQTLEVDVDLPGGVERRTLVRAVANTP